MDVINPLNNSKRIYFNTCVGEPEISIDAWNSFRGLCFSLPNYIGLEGCASIKNNSSSRELSGKIGSQNFSSFSEGYFFLGEEKVLLFYLESLFVEA